MCTFKCICLSHSYMCLSHLLLVTKERFKWKSIHACDKKQQPVADYPNITERLKTRKASMDLLRNSLPAIMAVFQLQPSFKIFHFDCPEGIFSEPTVAGNLPVPLTAFFFLWCWSFGEEKFLHQMPTVCVCSPNRDAITLILYLKLILMFTLE